MKYIQQKLKSILCSYVSDIHLSSSISLFYCYHDIDYRKHVLSPNVLSFNFVNDSETSNRHGS